MAKSVPQSAAKHPAPSLAKSLAPEDVQVGDYVAPLHEVYELPSFLWCSDSSLADRAETVTIRLMAEESGVPLKVKAVCLPFVLVRHPQNGTYSLDVRRHQLARLDHEYAAQAWQSLKSRDAKKREGKKPKKKKTKQE